MRNNLFLLRFSETSATRMPTSGVTTLSGITFDGLSMMLARVKTDVVGFAHRRSRYLMYRIKEKGTL